MPVNYQLPLLVFATRTKIFFLVPAGQNTAIKLHDKNQIEKINNPYLCIDKNYKLKYQVVSIKYQDKSLLCLDT